MIGLVKKRIEGLCEAFNNYATKCKMGWAHIYTEDTLTGSSVIIIKDLERNKTLSTYEFVDIMVDNGHLFESLTDEELCLIAQHYNIGIEIIENSYEMYEILNDWCIDMDTEAERLCVPVYEIFTYGDFTVLEQGRDMYESVYEALRVGENGLKYFETTQELYNIIESVI